MPNGGSPSWLNGSVGTATNADSTVGAGTVNVVVCLGNVDGGDPFAASSSPPPPVSWRSSSKPTSAAVRSKKALDEPSRPRELGFLDV